MSTSFPKLSGQASNDREALEQFLRTVPNVETLWWLANPQLTTLAHAELVRRLHSPQSDNESNDHNAKTADTPSTPVKQEDTAQLESRLLTLESDVSKVEQALREVVVAQQQQQQQQQQRQHMYTPQRNTSSQSPTEKLRQKARNSEPKEPRYSDSKAKVIERTSSPVLSPTAAASVSALHKLQREAKQRKQVWWSFLFVYLLDTVRAI